MFQFFPLHCKLGHPGKHTNSLSVMFSCFVFFVIILEPSFVLLGILFFIEHLHTYEDMLWLKIIQVSTGQYMLICPVCRAKGFLCYALCF